MVTRRKLVASACGLAALSLAPRVLHATPIAVSHAGISGVAQGSSNLCWLASAAMLMSWKKKAPVSMADAASQLGGAYKQLYDKGEPLQLSSFRDLAAKLQMTPAGLASFAISWWVDKIKKGPMMLAGYTPNTQRMGHAVVLSGMKGDSDNPASIAVETWDPNSGKKTTANFMELIRFYEGLAPAASQPEVSAPQILHY